MGEGRRIQNQGSKIILITGGARSGKSSFALKEAGQLEGKKLYVATAEPLDGEMQERIEKHRQERGADWDTVEEPLKIVDAVKNADAQWSVAIIDCLTLWLTNIMMRAEMQTSHGKRIDNVSLSLLAKGGQRVGKEIPDDHGGDMVTEKPKMPVGIEKEIDAFIESLNEVKCVSQNLSLFIVSNEVGMGIVPQNPLTRFFRDMAGRVNQKVAEIADEVYLLVSGIPLKVK